MSMMTDERLLLQSDGKNVTLTTHRVRYQSRRLGFTRVVSVMLDNLTSCELKHKSHPWLLVVAAVFVGIAGYYATLPAMRQPTTFAAIAAGGLIVAYFVTRTGIVALASPTAKITFRVKKRTSAEHFIDATESAKNDRYFAPMRPDRSHRSEETVSVGR